MINNGVFKRLRDPFILACLLFVTALMSLFTLLQFFPSGIIKERQKTDNRIGIVHITGVITNSEKTVGRLKKFEKDDSVKGILLRIETPGGGVGASQEIYNEVLRIKKRKKIFVSMGGLAASGGYYIACGADRIFANSGTITGSLGVIMAFSNIEGLLKRVGLKTVIIKSGRYKDIGQPARTMTTQEQSILQAVSDNIHLQFMRAVSAGRNLELDAVRKLADGRIFSGEMALKAGLVDELGGREDAISNLAESLGITGTPEVVEDTDDKNFFLKLLTGRFAGFFNSENSIFYSGAQFLFRGF